MLKLYYFIQSKIQSTELKLSSRIQKRINEPYSSRLFFFNLVVLNQLLVFYQIFGDLVKYVIILTRDPGISFNIFFRQKELRSCPFSYSYYKTIQAKVRILSLAGATTIILVAIVSSIITNLIFGGKLPTWAAQYGWTQARWTGGADVNNYPNHANNKDNGGASWLKYYSASNIDTRNNELKIATSSSGTSTTVFAGLGTSNNIYQNFINGFATLKKLDAASCLVVGECAGTGCSEDFDSIGNKYCHATNGKCIDYSNGVVVEYSNNIVHCLGNTYSKICTNGTWGATTSIAAATCTPTSGANNGITSGGWISGICNEGNGFSGCTSCSSGFVSSVANNGCYTNCSTSSNCVSGLGCFGGACCSDACCGVTSVSYNSDTYGTVVIGTQCWLNTNLRSPKKPDGTALTYTCNAGDTNCATPNGNADANGAKYGAMYSWTTLMNGSSQVSTGPGPQGICPSGWHLPSDGEQYILENYLKDSGQTCDAARNYNTDWDCNSAGTKLKSGGSSGFNFPLSGGTIWSASDLGSSQYAYFRQLDSSHSTIIRYDGHNFSPNKGAAAYVRCIKNY